MVGITATTPIISNAREIARKARILWPDCQIVMGGVHPTVLPEETLSEPVVDVVVRGEGEITITDLANGKSLKDIRGISWRQDGQIVHNPEQVLIEDLDSLPMPAYHLLPMDKYYPSAGATKRLLAISMLTTRGCPGRCTFCYRIFGKKLRVRSGRKVAEEARHLQDNYGIKEICFYDDTFTVFNKEAIALEHTITHIPPVGQGGGTKERVDIPLYRKDDADGEPVAILHRVKTHIGSWLNK